MVAGDPKVLRTLADGQAGMVTWRQSRASGLSASAVEHRVRRGSWVRELPAVYRTFTGRPDALSRAWAALLYAGRGAILGPDETLALQGLLAWPEPALTIVVPADRRVRAQPTVKILHSRRIEAWRHEASSIPRMRLEAAVILRVDRAVSRSAVIDILVGATSGRRTTTSRLRYELGAWPRLHHRVLLAEVLEDVEDGVASPLERHWRRHVERPHGLPSAGRNVRVTHSGRSLYRDLDYDPYRLVAELDGRLYHPDAERFRDRARDNLAARQQRFALRYGWREVVGDPCGCALEVADVLNACGWPGHLRPCGPSCTAVNRAAVGM